MARFVLQNVRLFVGGLDLTTNNNKVDITAEVEEKDVTAFTPTGQVWHESLAGIRTTNLDASGQWDSGIGLVDPEMFANLGAIQPWSACPDGAAFGALAYTTAALRQSYMLGGSVGDVAPWNAKGAGSWPLVRGYVITPAGTITSGIAYGSAALQIPGGVPAGKSLYAAMHVLSATGTTPQLDALVQSATTSGMTSPVHRILFASATGRSSQIMRVAGPITDTYFNVYADISGTTPAFQIFIVIGVA